MAKLVWETSLGCGWRLRTQSLYSLGDLFSRQIEIAWQSSDPVDCFSRRIEIAWESSNPVDCFSLQERLPNKLHNHKIEGPNIGALFIVFQSFQNLEKEMKAFD